MDLRSQSGSQVSMKSEDKNIDDDEDPRVLRLSILLWA